MSVKIANRQELLQFFNESLRSEIEYYAGTEKSRYDVGRVKTFLVESNLEEFEVEGVDECERIFKYLKFSGQENGFEIERTNDESLLIVTVPEAIGSVLNKTFYLDISDYRFWAIFTLAKIDVAEEFLFKKLLKSIEIDHAWFPSQMLKKVLAMGQSRGYGGYFNNYPILKNFEGVEREELSNQISMKLWGNHADDFLDAIGKTPLKNQFSFYNARVKYSFGGENVTEDLYYNGKIGTAGQSFNAHIDLIKNVFLKEYKNIIVDKIENELAIDYKVKENAVFISGEPIQIRFNQEKNLNIDHFINSVFDGTKPFRLLGTIVKKKSDFARINALDLHVGEPLMFMIRPDNIQIYLPSKTCGNTVARFLTLFQRHFIATAEAIGKDDNVLF